MSIPHKVTRICWNSNHWTTPSGQSGKSQDNNNFEANAGFGFEEWNFDFSKVIDGYIYGYVPAASPERLPHPSKIPFDLSFYTIEQQKKFKQRWWLGTIHHVEIINPSESNRIYKIYEKNGWLEERFNQLQKLGIDYQKFRKIFPNNFFNIRYKLENINLLEMPISFDHKNSAVKSNYYNFLNYSHDPIQPSAQAENISKHIEQQEYFFRSAYTAESASFQKLHAVIHNLLIKDLKSTFKHHSIYSEYLLNNNTRVDIAVKDQAERFTLYEIKIARNLREVIRQSIGQLLEYAFALNYENIHEMKIVSIFDINDPIYSREKQFLQSLIKQFKLPISYHRITVHDT